MATVVTALIIVGVIALAVGLLVVIHRRDQKREALKNKDAFRQLLD
jgi:uncharacterized membrane protein HdeD (DUF308 family)